MASVARRCLCCFGGGARTAGGGGRKASWSSGATAAARAVAELRGAWGARVVECEAPVNMGAAAGAPLTTPRGSPVLSFVHGRLVMPPEDGGEHVDPVSGGERREESSQRGTSAYAGRIILVGDVHGCLGELKSLLSLAEYGDGDIVMLVGDLVNKGPSSVGVISFARERGMLAVRGNHDDVAIGYGRLCAEGRTDEVPEEWQWTKDLSEEDITFMSRLPFTIDIPEHNVIVVHAGLVPGLETTEQKMEDMYLMRNVVVQDVDTETSTSTATENGNGANGWRGNAWSGTSKASIGEAWASQWRGPRHVVFGHDALRKLQKYPLATGTKRLFCFDADHLAHAHERRKCPPTVPPVPP